MKRTAFFFLSAVFEYDSYVSRIRRRFDSRRKMQLVRCFICKHDHFTETVKRQILRQVAAADQIIAGRQYFGRVAEIACRIIAKYDFAGIAL